LRGFRRFGEIVKSGTLKSDALLLLAAVIWGFAFVAQRVGMQYVGPFTFNAVRFALGALVLVPFILWRSRRGAGTNRREDASRPAGFRPWMGGCLAGCVLFAGASLQQVGIVHTTAGKAGFITGLYVILVPILGLLFRQRPGRGTWVGAATATAGLYLLSATEGFRLAPGDGLVLGCAFFWAVHVLMIAWLVRTLEPIHLACLQFGIVSVLSFAVALGMESITPEGLTGAAVPILYGGLLSVGIAYTLQVVAQRTAAAAHAAIVLSLETVFAALGGWLILDETLTHRALWGCALMLAGIVLSQLGSGSRPEGTSR
jgi:drug/metabolite transporter (DMT)-like permease